MQRLVFSIILLAILGFLGGVPQVAQQLNGVAAGWVKERKFERANTVYKYLSLFGNLDAINNRAVMLYCGDGVEKNKSVAKTLFKTAADAGNVAARYNLAMMLPDRFKTPAGTIKYGISLLQPNVKVGDRYSAALLARRLYFVNRDAYVPDRLTQKRQLLKFASSANDRDFLILYGKELASQGRTLEDVRFTNNAVDTLLQADRLGDARAAYQLGHIRWQLWPWLLKAGPPEALMRQDRFGWWRKSSRAGFIHATCLLGSHLYDRSERRLDRQQIDQTTRQRADRRFAAGKTDMRSAVRHMKSCLNYRKKNTGQSPVIARRALRLRKVRPGVPSMRGHRGWANYKLGLAYAKGMGVRQNQHRAKKYLSRAADTYKFKNAKLALQSLNAQD